jgi:hypothetical protein
MGIFLSPAQRMTERRKVLLRAKLVEELRNRYIAEGRPEQEANERALAKVRARELKS